MDKIFFAAVAAILAIFSSFAQAGDEESAVYMQGEVIARSAKGQDTLVGKRLFAEYAIQNTNTAVSGEVYGDRDFKSWTLGVAQTFDSLVVSAGVGKARYNATKRTLVTVGVYYEGDKGLRASLDLERYLGDSASKYYKAVVYRSAGEHMFFGLYSETAFGTAPLVGINLGKHVHVGVAAWKHRAVASLLAEF